MTSPALATWQSVRLDRIDLAAHRPAHVVAWREALGLLHQARNGVAHDDRRAIVAVQTAGWPVRIITVRKWRNLLDETTSAMHNIVGSEIANLVGVNPWDRG